jgi:hypothetical protein
LKITIHHPIATVEWDSSLNDDRIELNQIARDIASGLDAGTILANYCERHKAMMEYDPPAPKAPRKPRKKRTKKDGKD